MNSISVINKRFLFFMLGLFLTMGAFAQNLTVKGNVKDSFGDPVIGGTVQIKGEQGGAVTNLDGDYTISNVKPDATLVFSYIGYATQEVAVNGQTTIDVVMQEDTELLDEVIVVGYAVGSKRTVSGAIERVKKEDLNKGIVTNAAEALKGKVAGLVISQSGGDPMGTTNIRVRGTSSLSGGNDPLVIIDGVFSDMTMFNALAPGDI